MKYLVSPHLSKGSQSGSIQVHCLPTGHHTGKWPDPWTILQPLPVRDGGPAVCGSSPPEGQESCYPVQELYCLLYLYSLYRCTKPPSGLTRASHFPISYHHKSITTKREPFKDCILSIGHLILWKLRFNFNRLQRCFSKCAVSENIFGCQN